MSDSYMKIAKKLYGLNKFLVKIEAVVMGLLFAVIVVVIMTQVICRYYLYIPTPWAEEIAQYLCVWMVYIGAAYTIFHQDDIVIDLIDTVINAKCKDVKRAKYILGKISNFLTMVVIAICCGIYWEFLAVKIQRAQYSPTIGINMVIPMSACMVGFVLMLFHSFSLLIIPESARE